MNETVSLLAPNKPSPTHKELLSTRRVTQTIQELENYLPRHRRHKNWKTTFRDSPSYQRYFEQWNGYESEENPHKTNHLFFTEAKTWPTMT